MDRRRTTELRMLLECSMRIRLHFGGFFFINMLEVYGEEGKMQWKLEVEVTFK